MTTFRTAATAYLTKITPTHTPSTMRTYQRNFAVVLVPYFGANTPLSSITSARVQAFLTAEALLTKPNGQPRAEPTKDQITGLLRSFLQDAATAGLTDAIEMPARSRQRVERLCARCRQPLEPIAEVPPTEPVPSAVEPAATPSPTPAARKGKVKAEVSAPAARTSQRKAKPEAKRGKPRPTRK